MDRHFRRFRALTASILSLSLLPALALAWPQGNLLLTPVSLERTVPACVSDGLGGQILVWEEDYRGGLNLFAKRVDASGVTQWGPSDVCTAAGHQKQPTICADGSGGVVIAWEDYRAGATANIYAQHLDASGGTTWTTDGVALCTAIGDQRFPEIATDGSGGAIVTWWDRRSGAWDAYARRINGSGTPQWTADGVALCALTGDQLGNLIVSDGSGGAVIAWSDSRSGTSDVYAQRLNSAGAAQWTANGVVLCNATGDQTDLAICSDGSGGAMVAWADYRGGANSDLYVRRITAAGAPQWTANGVSMCAAAGDQNSPTLVADGLGGAIAAWADDRGGATSDIYSQRVNSFGITQWTLDGVALTTAADNQGSPVAVPDGTGGAIVAWSDLRAVTGSVIYARRITSAGAPQWTADGVALSSATGGQFLPVASSDGVGGIIATWEDGRGGALSDIYSQRVNASGIVQWDPDGIPAVTNTVINQELPQIASDGAGGAIVVWEETYIGQDLYAQRFDGSGAILWASGGVPVCTAAGQQNSVRLVGDGTGGAVISWSDYRSGTSDIYAQRLNASGAALWTSNGVALCTAANQQFYPVIVSDGASGAIVTWQDFRNDFGDIYAQRVNSAGVPQWTANGLGICVATNSQRNPSIASDGAGGAIIAWDDGRNGTDYNIYARRVDVAGTLQWTINGVALCIAVGDQQTPQIVVDGAGGAIVAWVDRRNGSDFDSYARRITSAGVPQWTADGVAVAAGTGNQSCIDIVPDGSGGAIAAWCNDGAARDIDAQRLSSAGATQWNANGVAVCTASGDQSPNSVVSDGSGGAIITWTDYRSSGLGDFYAQRLSSAGAPQWTPDGAAVCTQPGSQYFPNAVTDGAGGALVVWEDSRAPDWDIYAHRLAVTGPLEVPRTIDIHPGAWLGHALPNPTAGSASIEFGLPTRARMTLAIFDAQGRRVRELVNGFIDAGRHSVRWDGRDDGDARAPAGVYFYSMEVERRILSGRLVRLGN